MENTTITASEGNVFMRIHDQQEMGSEISLGTDYSTGIARLDKAEYYEEIEITIWHSETCNKRIVAPIALVNSYPQLLLDLTVVRKLQVEKSGDNILIYCNYIEPEHQALIDGSKGLIRVESQSIN